ncbi:hypothetical protein JIN80_04810 [Cerasicoccus arenae]|nr:hypothetical protein [Cerasicoccus arenae]
MVKLKASTPPEKTHALGLAFARLLSPTQLEPVNQRAVSKPMLLSESLLRQPTDTISLQQTFTLSLALDAPTTTVTLQTCINSSTNLPD